MKTHSRLTNGSWLGRASRGRATMAVAATLFAACDMEIGDLNNPSVSELESAPTPALVRSAATGLLIGHRNRMAIDDGYVATLGVLGREALIFAASDPGFITELLQKEPGLDPGSVISGGDFWRDRYANINNAEVLLRATDRVAGMTETEKEGVRGFAKTIEALDYLVVINTRDTHGAPIEVAGSRNEPLPPVICKDGVLAHIVSLLDEAREHLESAGDAFSFPLSSGFAGFETPAQLIAVNRAIKARLEVYRGEHESALLALEESFIRVDPEAPQLDLGVYNVYGEGPGDALNALISFNIYAHPSVLGDSDPQDLRLAKVRVQEVGVSRPSEKPGSFSYSDPDEQVSSNVRFTLYEQNTSPVPIIRNEELILLRAEASLGVGSAEAIDAAVQDINFIRVHAGGLPALSGADDPLVFQGNLLDELLQQRRYSLLFEGGHRWIDMRRHGKLDELPLDSTRHVVHEKLPLPTAETDAREGNVACVDR